MLCDAFHCIGMQPFDRKKMEKEEERVTKNRLLGFDKNKEASKAKNLVRIDGELKDFKKQVENLSQDDIAMLMQYEEEMVRKGYYEVIFPKPSNIKNYERFFECPRYNNMLLWSYLKYGKSVSLGKYLN